MKKKKEKSLVKATKKTARRVLKISLVTELEQLTGNLGQGSKKLTKEIEKGSKELAKKLVKKFKLTPVVSEPEETPVKTDNKAEKAPEKIKPVIKKTAPAKKTVNTGTGKIEI